ncbi:hypothetical protein [Saccharothrix sp. ALI-22-I]|uniref:hypothetical protein n=1 Tax=Saccharothrix sp. ALI-22-I TaxID=1933778 RepID=UPI001179F6D5|nr:hypothetical protein [Saccharothrix sp. ALI-22-I]
MDGLSRLAVSVDAALWSGVPADARVADEAWRAVRDVRRGLARSPAAARLRAALLLPPSRVGAPR